jgi:hypothetical protein
MFKRAITHRDEFITAQALIMRWLDSSSCQRISGPKAISTIGRSSSRNFRSRFARWLSEFPIQAVGFYIGRLSWRPLVSPIYESTRREK